MSFTELPKYLGSSIKDIRALKENCNGHYKKARNERKVLYGSEETHYDRQNTSV